jgi:hypothetical protein
MFHVWEFRNDMYFIDRIVVNMGIEFFPYVFHTVVTSTTLDILVLAFLSRISTKRYSQSTVSSDRFSIDDSNCESDHTFGTTVPPNRQYHESEG